MVKKGLGRIAARLLLTTGASLKPRHFALGSVAAPSIQVMVVRPINDHLLLIAVLLLVVESVELLLGLQKGALCLDERLSIRVLLGLLLTCRDGHTADDIHKVLRLLPALSGRSRVMIRGELLLLLLDVGEAHP